MEPQTRACVKAARVGREAVAVLKVSQSASRLPGHLDRRRRVLLVLEVRIIEEPNRPDVTGADPSLPQLARSGTDGLTPRINRRTGREQREMPMPRTAVIDAGV
jgi:hypothetical protein